MMLTKKELFIIATSFVALNTVSYASIGSGDEEPGGSYRAPASQPKEADPSHLPDAAYKGLRTTPHEGPAVKSGFNENYDLATRSSMQDPQGKNLNYGRILLNAAEAVLTAEEFVFYKQAVNAFGNKGSAEKLNLYNADYNKLLNMNKGVRDSTRGTDVESIVKKAIEYLASQAYVAKENDYLRMRNDSK